MLGTCQNIGPKCDSWEALIPKTSLSVSSVRGLMLASWRQDWMNTGQQVNSSFLVQSVTMSI